MLLIFPSSPFSCRVTICLGKSGTRSWRPQYEQLLSFLSSSSISPLPTPPCFNTSPSHFLSGKVPSKVEIETGPILQRNEGIYHNIPPTESSHLSILYILCWSSGTGSSEGNRCVCNPSHEEMNIVLPSFVQQFRQFILSQFTLYSHYTHNIIFANHNVSEGICVLDFSK